MKTNKHIFVSYFEYMSNYNYNEQLQTYRVKELMMIG